MTNKEKQKCIEFFNGLSFKQPLHEFAQNILVFCHSNSSSVRLGMPKYVRINDTQELGPSAEEHWIEIDNQIFTLNKTSKEIIEFLNKNV